MLSADVQLRNDSEQCRWPGACLDMLFRGSRQTMHCGWTMHKEDPAGHGMPVSRCSRQVMQAISILMAEFRLSRSETVGLLAIRAAASLDTNALQPAFPSQHAIGEGVQMLPLKLSRPQSQTCNSLCCMPDHIYSALWGELQHF